MVAYKTPGVYVEEISTLPPSVAEVATAIPAFIGYTAEGPSSEVKVEEIRSMVEYQVHFGTATPTPFEINADDTVQPRTETFPKNMLWYALSMYFNNGGGRCYVISVGNVSEEGAPNKDRLEAGLERLSTLDEPTLIVVPEAVMLSEEGFVSVAQESIQQCEQENLRDRFAILDVQDEDGAVQAFRNRIQGSSYAAAYRPFLQTTLAYRYADEQVKVQRSDDEPTTLDTMRTTETARYNAIGLALRAERVTLPPSAAIAGVYASVDRSRGVWKAPANVSLAGVIRPTIQISHAEQEDLNVDVNGGKSINAIRSFTGRGVLVWGSRTLLGNSNEWRYVNVRRLFIMIEESAKKSSAFAVFEPNDATTWLKVKGMIESFLYGLWERGALQGATPEAAYFVDVGLNKTMTADDINNGRLIVQIGIAAVRPAEFIILRFSHKLAEA